MGLFSHTHTTLILIRLALNDIFIYLQPNEYILNLTKKYIYIMEKRHLEKLIRLPLDELKLAFAASCVEGIARKTGKHYSEVYERMSKVGAIENYILKNYDTLHTESNEYVLEDVEEYIQNRERSATC